MTDLTAMDVIRNLTLDATMVIVSNLGDAVDWDDKSRAIADLVATDLLDRFNDNFAMAQQFANTHGLVLTVTLA